MVEIRSPWDGEVAGTIRVADEGDLERGIVSAQRAFETTRKLPRWKRAEICRGISERIKAGHERLSELITRESGKPLQYARGEVSRAVTTFATAAEEALRIGGEVIPLDIAPASDGYAGMSLRFPIGPIAAISPFNFPLNLVAHKVAPALAAGNTILLKPPPQAPLTAMELGKMALEAGAPPGAFNVLHMEIPLAEKMAADPRFKLLSFTGSAKVGWHLKSICGKKRVVLELGGNAAMIVHEDADLDWALKRAVAGAFASSGQVCIKVQRLFVHRPIYDGFLKRFCDAAAEVSVGDPMNAETVVGPLIDEAAAKRVESWIKEARDAGARILAGGTRDGNVITPTVIEGAPGSAKVSCEEVFGPVCTVAPYDDFAEGLRMVNDTRYGLQAGVFTRDIGRIAKAVSGLEVGGVIINHFPMFRVDNYPYGGIKDSGLGREGVRYAIEDMTEQRMVVLRLGE